MQTTPQKHQFGTILEPSSSIQMMTKIIFPILVAACLVVACTAQNCLNEVNTMRDCMTKQIERALPKHADFDKAAFKGSVTQCFRNNGCQAPDLGKDGDEDDMEEEGGGAGPQFPGFGEGGGGPPKSLMSCMPGGEGTIKAMKKCAEKVMPKLKSWMEKCVAQKTQIANFKFPELPEMDGQDGGPQMIFRKMLGMKKHLGAAFGAMKGMRRITGAAFDPDVCPKSARNAIPGCLANKMKGTPLEWCTKSGIEVAFDIRQKKEKLCQAKDSCAARMSASCKENLKKVPGALCSCVQRAVGMDALKNQMVKCIASEGGQALPQSFLQSPVGRAMKQKMTQMLAKKMGEKCDKLNEEGLPDPCDPKAYKRGPPKPPPRPRLPTGGENGGPPAGLRSLLSFLRRGPN